jgi:membrane protease YdiL (CAAX protease family)
LENENISIKQYSLLKILLIWASAAIPIGICGWVLAPLLQNYFNNLSIGRMVAITIGLIWQFILTLILLKNEYGRINISVIKNGLMLNNPKIPGTNKENKFLWFLIIPIILITAFFQIYITKIIINWWTNLIPIFTEPYTYSLSSLINSEGGRNEISGSWWILAIWIICAIFNTFLGEEFLFRGILLPRMKKIFKNFDWLVNGILFGLYHTHQPWGILATAILSSIIWALMAKLFKSTWFSIIPHSGQSIYFSIIIFLLVIRQ